MPVIVAYGWKQGIFINANTQKESFRPTSDISANISPNDCQFCMDVFRKSVIKVGCFGEQYWIVGRGKAS